MSKFQNFKEEISGITLPEKFTFPFYYEPHTLTLKAAQEVQSYLENENTLKHNFGLDKGGEGVAFGKMFGVLVVQNQNMDIGYLAAFSGKLVDKVELEMFVPPVCDIHAQNSFYKKGEKEINQLNKQVEILENDPRFKELQKTVEANALYIDQALARAKDKFKLAKKARKSRREEAVQNLSESEFKFFKEELAKQSLYNRFLFKSTSEALNKEGLKWQEQLRIYTDKIETIKKERKVKSARLQQEIFESYQFLNQHKKTKKLTEIFPGFRVQKPPAGSGDCCAPKLLQYAYLNDLKPIAMGEFWWGVSPKTEIRKHKNFYPACGGRCKPILAHMLGGVVMDDNPFLKSPAENIKIPIVFEDDYLLVVNKPVEFLSVPGKEISDSVYSRMKTLYPEATGPLIVHRLDMSTSGILIIAKTKESHKALQSQFIKRALSKRYVALLDGVIQQEEGEIVLPLRVDLDDRPRQLVCYEYGKAAKTKWKVVSRLDGKTRVYLYPVTGRTHQLRVHASHSLGLNTPIVGDDLYGNKGNRLHLHAEFIEFLHPLTKAKMSFTIEPDF